MCGIFAFAGPAGPDSAVLAAASRGAAQRGPHAHGWIARQGDAATVHKQLGPAGECTSCGLEQRTEQRILGHSRLATFGSPDDPAAIQPLAQGGSMLAHNGNVYNAAGLTVGEHPSDSGALLDLYTGWRVAGLTPSDALSRVVDAADQKAWALVIVDLTGELVVHRHVLPLYRLTHPTGVYLSSVRCVGAEQIPADTVTREAPALPTLARRL